MHGVPARQLEFLGSHLGSHRPLFRTPGGPYTPTETICGEAVERSVGGVRV